MNINPRIRSDLLDSISLNEIGVLVAGVGVATIISSILYANSYLQSIDGYDYVTSPYWMAVHLLSVYGPIGIAQVLIFRRFVSHPWRWVIGEVSMMVIGFPLLIAWLTRSGHHDAAEALAFFDYMGINPFIIIIQSLIVLTWVNPSLACLWLVLSSVARCLIIPVVFLIGIIISRIIGNVGFIFTNLMLMAALEVYVLTWILDLQRVATNKTEKLN